MVMAKMIDARGLACPQPVVLTSKALAEGDEVITIVDNEAAKENVSRLATSRGFQVSAEEREGAMYLHLTQAVAELQKASFTPISGPTVLLIPSDSLGRGDEELGKSILIRSFIHTLGEVSPKPNKIIFINSGVKLVTKGSEVVTDLRNLERQGIEILACGTCLGYYELKESVEVGQVSNMYTIVEELFQAGKIISL
jgi:selenium metabolism protein YedF